MVENQITIVNALGLHARAAAKVVRLACTFPCTITLRREDSGQTADAKSILSLLHLAAGNNVTISIIADGDDEAAALAEIKELFLQGFGEN